jgi:hypothetical protein
MLLALVGVHRFCPLSLICSARYLLLAKSLYHLDWT